MQDSVRTVCRQDRVSIWPRCSGQTRSILTAHAQLVNSKILRMDVVDLGRNIDRMLLPAIYQNGVEKPAMCWTFEMAIGAISDQTLRGFLQRLRGRFGIAERCLELTIRKFKVSLSTKDFKVTPEFPKGRLFEIDCEEQWQTALKYLVNRERELIGTCCALTYSYLLKVRQSSKELKSIICFIYLPILVDGYRKLNWDCFDIIDCLRLHLDDFVTYIHMTCRFQLSLLIIPGLNKCIISYLDRYWKAFILKISINIPSGCSILFEKRYGFLWRCQLFSCFTDFPDQQTHKHGGVLHSQFIISVAINS